MQRRSKKREAIYDALVKSCDHPTACELYLRVMERVPGVSISTVYRNLSEFCAEGKAIMIVTSGGEERFDGNLCAHDHFICRLCGKAFDEERTDMGNAVLRKMEKKGRRPETVSVFGVCENCIGNDAM